MSTLTVGHQARHKLDRDKIEKSVWLGNKKRLKTHLQIIFILVCSHFCILFEIKRYSGIIMKVAIDGVFYFRSFIVPLGCVGAVPTS